MRIWLLLSLCALVPVHAQQIVSKNGKYGVANSDGKEIIPAEYKYIIRENEYFVAGNASALNRLTHRVKKVFASFIDILPDAPCISLPPGGGNCNHPSHASQVELTTTAIFYDFNGKRIGAGEYVGKNTEPFVKGWILYLKTTGEAVFVNEKGVEVLFLGGDTVAEAFSKDILIVEKWSGQPNRRRFGLLSLDAKIRTPINTIRSTSIRRQMISRA